MTSPTGIDLEATEKDLRDAHGHWMRVGYPEGCGVLLKRAADAISQSRALAASQAEQIREAKAAYRCYHCGFIATTDEEARGHFGKSEDDDAACLLSQVFHLSAMVADRGRAIACQAEEVAAERNKYAWLRSEAILRGAFENGIAIDAAYAKARAAKARAAKAAYDATERKPTDG